MTNDRDITIDTPDNQGGGNTTATAEASGMEAAGTDQAAPIDPPDNQGGGN